MRTASHIPWLVSCRPPSVDWGSTPVSASLLAEVLRREVMVRSAPPSTDCSAVPVEQEGRRLGVGTSLVAEVVLYSSFEG